MKAVRRRLFWKVYLTLLAGLVGAVFAMGTLWWTFGESPRQRLGTMRERVAAQSTVLTEATGPAVEEAVKDLGDALGADIALYAPGGALLAARGDRAALIGSNGDVHPRFVMRFELAQGRTLLLSPLGQPVTRLLGIASLALTVIAGVGLAAFPVATRLTRRLERLRAVATRWGDGDLNARVTEEGQDEVAAVARAFNGAAERVDALLAAQRTLLANASHELRSPLARLRMAVDLWATRPDGPAREEVVRNLSEIDALVEEILLSSRLDHAAPGLGHLAPVDLLGLAAEEAIRVGAEVEGDPAEIVGDEVLLRRLLRNLLENGVRHGKPPVRIRVEARDEAARVTVTDDGPGIAPEERARVFEPFYRPSGRGEAAGGWGLGLALVRQIAERHGGTATCREADDGRSRFVVWLRSAQA
jgi:signal transduction histidine kinase